LNYKLNGKGGPVNKQWADDLKPFLILRMSQQDENPTVTLLRALEAIHVEAISLITTRLAQLGKFVC
jgi:hypothetical protein